MSRFGTTYASVTPTAESRPTLAATLAGDNIRISWSRPTAGFILEGIDNLAAGTWTPAPAGNPVENPRTGPTRSFA